MAKIVEQEEVVGCSGKASLLGYTIPAWVYLVDGLLVDTGPYSLRKELIPFYRDRMIDQVAITHVHEDHCGLAAYLQKEKQVPVYVPQASVNEAGNRGKIPLYRRLIWSKRPAFSPSKMPDYLESEKFTFRVLPSPGHCNEHVSFLEEQRGWLFTGDVYVRKDPVVAFKDESMNVMIDTLKYLLKFDFQTVFCAHAGILEQGREALSAKLDFLLEKRDMVKTMRERGKPDKEIEKSLYSGKLPIELISGGEWTRRNVVKTIL